MTYSAARWWIRNCGLMLFRALIERLLGSDDLRRSEHEIKFAKFSYENYPGLLEILIGLLRPQRQGDQIDISAVRIESMFPALQILQRAPPPQSRRQEVSRLVHQLAGSKNWHVREMAARTFAHIQDANLALADAGMLPDSNGNFNSPTSQNKLHGNLLILKYSVSAYLNTLKGERTPYGLARPI